jgi:hypothetical protein
MSTTVKKIVNPADLPTEERIQLEDKIMERALALWRKKGPEHVDALNAYRQAEREIFSHNGIRLRRNGL